METSESTALLREIVEQQKRQVALQSQSLELQREHLDRVDAQLARAERVNAGAELLQRRAATAFRMILWVALPLVLVVLALMLWLEIAPA
jgi:ABC-type uncharacterized transport system involved in gliding motility auxiliary subunit